MSKIEKALEKSKKERKSDKGRTSIPVRDDTVQSNVHNKDTSIHNLKSSLTSKSDRSGSHIISAIERKGNEISTERSPLIGKDYDQLDSNLISQMQDNSNKKEKAESVVPSKAIDKYEVDEHIVSYYESIGQQTWRGPVMVSFRRLQVSLSVLQRSNMCKVMVFTSAQQNEGKSTLAMNTAITLTNDKKKRIAIVDCDFRKPNIHKILGFSPDKGLSDYLAEEADMKDILIEGLVPRLTIIPVGSRPSNASELFASDRMTHFVSCLREQFDYVIIDTPPVLAFPDTLIISPLTDGVVIVVNCKKTRKAIVKRTVETLCESNVIGFIMNKSDTAAVDYYGYSYYYDYASS